MVLYSEYYAVMEFFNRGGIVLYIIFAFAFILWALLLERYIYLYFSVRNAYRYFLGIWERYRMRADAMKIRNALKHRFSCRLKTTLPVMRMLIAVIPLLGLLGTVWGMIEIFDVIAIEGTGDARAMANGISMATLPTMSGMAIAIVTLFALQKLEDKTERRIADFQERLV